MLFNRHSLNLDYQNNLGLWEHLRRDNAATVSGAILSMGVLGLILIDIIFRKIYGVNEEHVPYIYKLVSIGKDNSFAENFNHGLSFSAAILFFTTAMAMRSRVCLGLAVFMAIAWFDDSTQYHERFGSEFSKIFPDTVLFGVGASHIGELLAWGTIGMVLLSLIFWASKQLVAGDRVVLRLVSFPVALLVVCASVIDLIHVVLTDTNFNVALMYLEDGGEMIAIVMLATISLYLVRNAHFIFDNTSKGRQADNV